MTARAIFAYRAARLDGAIERGSLEAGSREEVLDFLATRGLFAMEVDRPDDDGPRRARLSSGDLALGLRVLATLLEAGLPVGRALAAMEELAPSSWAPALPAIVAAVREGQSLGIALETSCIAIPSIVIGMVRAGEAGSGLAAAVQRAAEFTEQRAATRATIQAALAYPVLLATAGMLSVSLLVGVVLPRFAAILADLGQTLPFATRIVLTGSAVARASVLPLVLLAIGSVSAGRLWISSASGLARWHDMLRAVPVIGRVRTAAATARMTAALAALLDSGVALVSAIPAAADAAGDAGLARRLLLARDHIARGQRFGAALAAAHAATPTTIRLVRAGEETGGLAAMLAHASCIERERAEMLTKSAVRVLEPSLVVLFGGVVALVSAALLQAVYSVRPTQ